MITCQQMAQNGIQPSVALLRAKAPFKVSVTEAIEAIKHFNAANKPTHNTENRDQNKETIASLSKRIDKLEHLVMSLQQQLNAIKKTDSQ